MVLNLDRHGGDLMETLTIDPESIRLFKVSRPARRFSDTVTNPLGPIQGLRQIGPYDVNTSDPHLRRPFESFEVLCSYPAGDSAIRDDLSELVVYLDKGYSQLRGERDIEFAPLAETFHFGNAVFPQKTDFVPYDVKNLLDFEASIRRHVADIQARKNRPLVLVAVRSHKTIAATKNIYLPLKQTLTRLDVPSQFLSDYETTDTNLGVLYQLRSSNSFGWAVWNVALAIYLKVGGIPWAVTQGGNVAEHIDVSVGLRFARLDGAEPGFCLGVATVLDRFGRIVGAVPLENMEFHKAFDTPMPGMSLSTESAERLVTQALDKVLLDPRTQEVMQTRKPLTVAFHKLGPGAFHTEELSGIRQAMADKLRGREFKLAFVPIVATETLAMFGPPSQGRSVPDGYGAKLSEDTALLYTMASDRKFTAPVTVKLQNHGDDDCAFSSVEAACAHVQTLCGLHWQTVASGRLRLPADLQFAAHIARGFADGTQPASTSWLWKTQWYL